jgi:CRP-like cAMP-binding protein
VATTDCELIVIERREFTRLLRSQPDLYPRIIELLCSRLRRTTEKVEDMTFLNLPTRLAKVLLRLADDAKGPNKVAITQREISEIIGRSREMTNKQLRSWAKRGWLRVERGAVMILDRGKLTEVAALSPEADFLRDLV